jgi:hypothetical protein
MTYVNRRTFIVNRGCMDEAVTMLRQASSDTNSRIYRAHYGPFDTIAFEVEFANMAEMEQGWAAWSAKPEGATFMQRWLEITKSGGQNEVWIRE